jgi:hypothetical protein
MALGTWIGVIALSLIAVGGLAATGPRIGETGGTMCDQPGHETNGVPPGPPLWLNGTAPHGPPAWLNGTAPQGPPCWLEHP